MLRPNEQWAIERLQQLVPGLPPGPIIPGVPPAPDAMFARPEGNLGIEITDYFHIEGAVGAPQIQEALRYQVRDRVEAACRAAGNPAFLVDISFDRDFHLTKRALTPLVNELERAVIGGKPGTRLTIMHPAVDEVRIGAIPGKDTMVTTGDAAFLREITLDLLQRVLDEKEPKIPGYRHSCTEVWLLIVISGGRFSSFGTLSAALHHQYTTSFDGIKVLYDSDRIFELKTTVRP